MFAWFEMQHEDASVVDVEYETDRDDESWTLCTLRKKVKHRPGPIFRCVLPTYVLFNPYTCCKKR